MAHSHGDFVPALGADWLTPMYDFFARLVGEQRFKRHLIELANIAPDHDVLDLGCGTGTLALLVKAACPRAHVVGMDIDPKILSIARRKVERAAVAIDIEQGSATDPPFAPGSFDRVLSTLMLHHLTTDQKQQALRGVRGLLRPGGEFHVADFGRPHNVLMQAASLVFRLADGGEATQANLRGELPALIRDAGFTEVREGERWMTPFGTLAFVGARVAS